ncbi:MAG: hypothetical protein ACOX68_01435 [Candidatus Limivicinus sp.]|jgi:hypothetical protein
MKLKIRAGILAVLVTLAAYCAAGALKSLKPSDPGELPKEIYARFSMRKNGAEYSLRCCDGFVAVYKNPGGRSPLSVTGIEVSGLRGADRAMLEKGIPVTDTRELLTLLEDLGS